MRLRPPSQQPVGSVAGLMAELAHDDGPFLAAIAATTDAQWDELFAALDALDGITVFAEWAGGDVVDTIEVDGVEKPVQHVPYPVYTRRWTGCAPPSAAADLIVPFDWMASDGLPALPRVRRPHRRAGRRCCATARRHRPLRAVRRRQPRGRAEERPAPGRGRPAAPTGRRATLNEGPPRERGLQSEPIGGTSTEVTAHGVPRRHEGQGR